MATPAAIVTGAQRVSIASARLDAVGEVMSGAGRLGHSGVTPAARGLRPSRAGFAGRAVARRRRPWASSPRELSNGVDRR